MAENVLKIEYVPTDSISPYPNNAKLHPAEQIEQIKDSIEKFGFKDPIAVWKDNVIIEGHGRLIAALELGIEEVPIIRLDDLSDQDRRAYMLVHNKLTMNSGFDSEVLDLELESIDLDMEQFGFINYDIDWDKVPELNDDTYEEPQHNMLECPKCHHVDRDIHFNKVKGVAETEQNTND